MKKNISIKYFDSLVESTKKELFYKSPQPFSKDTCKDILQYTLGATLYCPANRKDLVNLLINNTDIKSLVFCLEDSIGEKYVDEAQEILLDQLNELEETIAIGQLTTIPLLFVRVRSAEHLKLFKDKFAQKLELLTGFIFPKFGLDNVDNYLSTFAEIRSKINTPLYFCPILEGRDIIEKKNRQQTLTYLKERLDANKAHVLNIRIGATDLLGLYGLRRNINYTTYDIAILRDLITDIINRFGIVGDSYVISGAVWEYFLSGKETFSCPLDTPEISKLIDEVKLDVVNGLWGKTSIHPSQLLAIQANHVVSYNDYKDACQILTSLDQEIGVMGSSSRNKMNESKPHQNWARQLLVKASVFGVYNQNKNYESLFEKFRN